MLKVECRIERRLAVDYVFQELANLPQGFTVPEGRTKPWGTTHAILQAEVLLNEPFAVINADDPFGKRLIVLMRNRARVIAFTLQGAAEWAEHQVRVNAVASGGVLTEMTMSLIGDDLDKATALVPLGRLSQPEEIAAAVLFYASDLAANITGQFFVVDGGGYGMQADPCYLTPAQIAAYARGVTTV